MPSTPSVGSGQTATSRTRCHGGPGFRPSTAGSQARKGHSERRLKCVGARDPSALPNPRADGDEAWRTATHRASASQDRLASRILQTRDNSATVLASDAVLGALDDADSLELLEEARGVPGNALRRLEQPTNATEQVVLRQPKAGLLTGEQIERLVRGVVDRPCASSHWETLPLRHGISSEEINEHLPTDGILARSRPSMPRSNQSYLSPERRSPGSSMLASGRMGGT